MRGRAFGARSWPAGAFAQVCLDRVAGWERSPRSGKLLKKEWALEGAWRSCPISKGDPWLIFLRGKAGLWGLRSGPSPGSDFIYTKISARPRSGFHVHKECRAAEIWILSTQRIPRGRGPILSTQTFYGACFNTKNGI